MPDHPFKVGAIGQISAFLLRLAERTGGGLDDLIAIRSLTLGLGNVRSPVTGPAGPAGPAGPVGAVGAVGAIGPVGAVGAVGVPGVRGPAGVVGAVGPQGQTGGVGSIGNSGAQGIAGLTGPAGRSGPSGPIGPPGPQGLEGIMPPIGTTLDLLEARLLCPPPGGRQGALAGDRFLPPGGALAKPTSLPPGWVRIGEKPPINFPGGDDPFEVVMGDMGPPGFVPTGKPITVTDELGSIVHYPPETSPEDTYMRRFELGPLRIRPPVIPIPLSQTRLPARCFPHAKCP